jgi:hypothetical protein
MKDPQYSLFGSEFSHMLDCLTRLHIKHSIDWGSKAIRNENVQAEMDKRGLGCTANANNAIVIGDVSYVFCSCEGVFLFAITPTGIVHRDQRIKLAEDGLTFTLAEL